LDLVSSPEHGEDGGNAQKAGLGANIEVHEHDINRQGKRRAKPLAPAIPAAEESRRAGAPLGHYPSQPYRLPRVGC
jgi:hypothetical protein